jgi:thiamine pyrophosphokinase
LTTNKASLPSSREFEYTTMGSLKTIDLVNIVYNLKNVPANVLGFTTIFSHNVCSIKKSNFSARGSQVL